MNAKGSDNEMMMMSASAAVRAAAAAGYLIIARYRVAVHQCHRTRTGEPLNTDKEEKHKQDQSTCSRPIDTPASRLKQ